MFSLFPSDSLGSSHLPNHVRGWLGSANLPLGMNACAHGLVVHPACVPASHTIFLNGLWSSCDQNREPVLSFDDVAEWENGVRISTSFFKNHAHFWSSWLWHGTFCSRQTSDSCDVTGLFFSASLKKITSLPLSSSSHVLNLITCIMLKMTLWILFQAIKPWSTSTLSLPFVFYEQTL